MISKITDAEIAPLKVASLPTHPTSPEAYGGRGFNALEMKEAFDALGLYIVDKLNELIGSFSASGIDSIMQSILTPIENKPLYSIITDITGGYFARYLRVLGDTLENTVARISSDLATVKEHLGIIT